MPDFLGLAIIVAVVIAGFDLHTQIYESARVLVMRGVRLADNAAVVVKRLRPEADTPQNRARMQDEFRVLQRLSQDHAACIVRPIELLEAAPGMALVCHDVGGASLRQLALKQPFSVLEALGMGLEACRGLADLHAAGLVHRQLSPDTVVYNRDTAQLLLIDLSMAVEQPSGVPALESLLLRESHARYMSPEQTGRLNRPVDARSDHYALGATLYEVLTGQPPFDPGDVTQLIYQILAAVPQHVSDLDPSIPAPVGDIVHKLLEKIPEQRYQSALGIAHDLSVCLQQLSAGGRIKPFRLASEDRSARLDAPRRLYGREGELEALNQAYNRVLARKAAELVVVRGPSGIGKSALVAEFALSEGLRSAQFAMAPHEEARAHVPFAGLRQALEELARQLLNEPTAAWMQWRQHLRTALAGSAQSLAPMAPALEQLLGVPPAAIALGTLENEHRLLLAWRRLFEALTVWRPLVLFLDDLQWADGGTLRLLSSLFQDAPLASGLLVVVAVRDAHGTKQDVLAATGLLERGGAPCKEIRLAPMSRAAVQELIEGATRRGGEATRSLAQWLHRLSGGNPFFVREGLKHLSRKQLIAYRLDEARWSWSMAEIESAQVPDDVAALLLEKLLAVESAQRRLLGYAACMGDRISLDLLRAVCTLTRSEAIVRLAAAVQSGILVVSQSPLPGAEKPADDVVYRFAHDRIRQTAYDLLPADEALAFHYGLARLHLDSLDPQRPQDWVFSVIGHINAARPLVKDAAELRLHARLNLVAAQAAKNAATYDAARNHIACALRCLPERPWETDYELMLQLALERIENEFLQGDAPSAAAHILEALEHVRTPEERAEALCLQVICQAEASQYEQALATGCAALTALGLPLDPGGASRRAAAWALWRARVALLGRSPQSFAQLPRITDRRLLCALRVLDAMAVPAYYTHARAHALVCATMVRLTLSHGTSPHGAFGLASLAAYWGRLDHFDRARQCATAAHALLQQQPDTWQRSKTLFAVNLFVDVLRNHPVEQNVYADTLQEMLLQDGALVYAGLNTLSQAQGLTMLSLSEALEKINHDKSFVHGRNAPRLMGWLSALRQTCLCLQGFTAHPGSLTTTDYNEEMEAARARREPGNMRSVGFWYGKIVTLWVHGQPAAARDAVVEAARSGIVQNGAPQSLGYVTFFMCLALMEHARQLGLRAVLDSGIFRRCLRRLSSVAQAGPAILAGLPRLIAAEHAALGGRDAAALAGFEAALPELERSGYVAAIAAGYEVAARFYLRRGLHERALASLQRARALYQQWGATVKVRMLDDELEARLGASTAADAHAPMPGRVDVPALVEATQALLRMDVAKTRLFANISHELRNPLTLVLGTLESLQAGPVSASERQQLQVGLRNGLRLLGLVDDLLTLARQPAPSGAPEATPAVVNVQAALRALVDLVRPWAQRKQIQLISEMPAEGAALAQMTPRELECVALNLLGNAVKFTPHDGRIALRLRISDAELTLSVADTGVGIDPELLPNIFGRAQAGGTGLGLALCKKIVEEHGGRIAVQSALGQGSTFTVDLPRVRDGEVVQGLESNWEQSLRTSDDYRLRHFGDIALEGPTAPAVQGSPGNGLLLVVASNPDMVAFLTSVLRQDYEVCAAADALQGLHAARALRPELVVIDAGLVGHEGVHLPQRLRADRYTAHIPLVMLTSQGEAGPLVEGLDAQLSKPFAPEELRACIRALLRAHRDPSSASLGPRSHALRWVVAGVSHEVVNPLEFIRSAVDQLREAGLAASPEAGPAQTRILEAARAAEEGVLRVRHAVDELRRFGNGGPTRPLVSMPLAAIVHSIQRLAGHDLRLAIDLQATRAVRARAGQLEQVLLNLVLNAQRAAGPSGTIGLRTWDDADDGVCLAVSDDGPGIDTRNLERIFQPFFTSRVDGVGLGLSISRQIVHDHGGELRAARASEGQGSSFTIRLPAAES